ncbi:MAG: right-handed parallel beta-helix repeat-containing protein, partial [Verrucomicrobiae bacterium]|nr:right-handed parallel beta-helix repeat-containing protein [Verrucomicrobiae bacterium]
LRHMQSLAVLLLLGTTFVSGLSQEIGKNTVAEFHVSPEGNDAWIGSREQPFATLERARDAVRAENQKSANGDINVWIRGGLYPIRETVVFGLDDSGSDNRTIRYQAYPGEEPVLTSAVNITGWKQAGEIPNLPTPAKGKVWVADLPDGVGLFRTLYDGTQRLPRARGKGFVPTIDAFGRDKKKHLRSRTELHFPEGALIKNWSNLDDIEIVIRPWALWVMNILPLAEVDEVKRIATTKVPGTYFLTRERYNRFGKESVWVENIIEGITQPGNWCVNTQERKIYYWPASGQPGDQIQVPTLREYIRVEGKIDKAGPVDIPVRHLVFKGLTFVHGDRDVWTNQDASCQHDWEMFDKDNAYLRLRGAEHCVIEECEIRNGSGGGIRLDLHAQENIIRNNSIHHLGGTGIFLGGYGLGRKDVNKKNQILNNHIHHIGEVFWMGAALTMAQTGENRVANNLIHNGPYNGISMTGYRPYYFHNAYRKALKKGTLEGMDYSWSNFNGNTEASGIRELRSIRWDETGAFHDFKTKSFETGYLAEFNLMLPFLHSRMNVIEYNEIHTVMQELGDGNGIYISDTGPANVIRYNYIHDTPNTGIRTDAHQRETVIMGNIIVRCGGGLAIYNNNHAYNNIVAYPGMGESVDGSKGHEGAYLHTDHGGFNDGIIQRNIWLLEGKSAPRYRVYKNVSQAGDDGEMQVDYNLVWFVDDPSKGAALLADSRKQGYEKHSICADPLFVDPKNGDFRLSPESPAVTKIGFQPLDINEMGLTKEFPAKFRNP